MSDTFDRYTIEQTRALGIPRGEDSFEPPDRDLLDYDLEGPVEEQETEVYGFPFNDPSDRPEFEPRPTSSDLLSGQNRKCASINRQGQPCGAYRRPGSQLCPFHDPNLADQLREARAEGGRRSIYQLPIRVDTNLQHVPLGLHTRIGIQSSMEAVMRMLLLGRIPTRHANVLMRYFNGAIRNLKAGPDRIAEHELREYTDNLREVLRAAGLIERDLEEQTRNDRIDQVSDVGSKREEVLQANKAFGFGPPPTAATPPPSPRIGYGPEDIRPFRG